MGARIPEPLEILKAAWGVGSSFMLPSQWCQISVQEHAGGEWTLQHSMDKGATWYDVKGDDEDTALVWDSKAIQTFARLCWIALSAKWRVCRSDCIRHGCRGFGY